MLDLFLFEYGLRCIFPWMNGTDKVLRERKRGQCWLTWSRSSSLRSCTVYWYNASKEIITVIVSCSIKESLCYCKCLPTDNSILEIDLSFYGILVLEWIFLNQELSWIQVEYQTRSYGDVVAFISWRGKSTSCTHSLISVYTCVMCHLIRANYENVLSFLQAPFLILSLSLSLSHLSPTHTNSLTLPQFVPFLLLMTW